MKETETMAKYDITHSCGHDETVNIVGPEKDRPRKREWLESQPCYECKREQAILGAQAWASKRGLVVLEGSEKQVAWAEKIRKEFVESFERIIDNISKRMEKKEEPTAEDEQDVIHMHRAHELLLRQSQAKFWIDHRDQLPSRLLLEFMDVIKKQDTTHE
jgi:hypothetical protein